MRCFIWTIYIPPNYEEQEGEEFIITLAVECFLY